jgi:hypothetical protein
MIEMDLRRELDCVAHRYRRLRLWSSLAICWFAFAILGAIFIWWSRSQTVPSPGMVPALGILAVMAAATSAIVALRSARSSDWLARRIERRFPELDARLLTAIGETRQTHKLGFLQQTVVAEALTHARKNDWETIVSDRSLTLAKFAQTATLCGFVLVLGNLILDDRGNRGLGLLPGGSNPLAEPITIKVEPEDTGIERGTSLLVMARFDARLPAEVRLAYRKPGAESAVLSMSKSLNDPLFAARIQSVDHDLAYCVQYDDETTRWYKVTVFDYPELVRADARLSFPAYTGMSETVVEDTRSVTAVEGTRLTLIMRLNKPVAEAKLVPDSGRASPNGKDSKPSDTVSVEAAIKNSLSLNADPVEPNTYTVSLVLDQSRRYRLQLVDADGRKNKLPPEFTINVTPNRPPDVKLVAPARDVQVSPIEELAIKARVYDDFGLRRYGVSYSIAGQPPQEIVLGESAPGKERREVTHVIAFESLKAEPDQLLSYFFWAEDSAPDGSPRRTLGDMYFAEVRPFEEIFRQGEQPTGEQMQQMQQGQQAGQNAQQAEQLANLQKQIINATWTLVRREISQQPSDKFVPDVQLIGESQTTAKEQAAALGERLDDPRSKAYLESVLAHMDRALAELLRAKDGPAIEALQPALAAEQAAYQALLKLRAREHEVVRANRRQQQQGGGGGGNRSQQQLDQLELDNSQNRYETQRSAPSLRSPEQEAQQRETRQVLNRLRELAQRQEDLNKQVKELQTALEEAKDEKQQEDIRRQLARLRDQQQEILRDTDELRDRMDRPENQERMADSREQLDQTRPNLRRASEALEQGQVSEAAAAGARAGEDLDRLRDEFRQATAGQFNEAVDELRNEAQKLDENQQKLSERLANLNQSNQRSLRDTGDRQQIVENLGQQKQDLQKLLENMRRTIEEAETAEPLLSKQLYDTVRQARRQQPEQALDTSRQLLERAFIDEARAAEREAGQGISDLRKGVEQAAESVLGDETEGLRRAQAELDSLAEQLNREINRAQPDSQQSGQQASTNPGENRGASGRQDNGESQDAQTAPGDADQQDERSDQAGSQQKGSQQKGSQQKGNRGQPGQQKGNGSRRGAQQRGNQQSSDAEQSSQQSGDQQSDEQQVDTQQAGGQQSGGKQSNQQRAGGGRGGRGQRPGGQEQDQQNQQAGDSEDNQSQDNESQAGSQQDGQQSGQQGGEQRGGQQQGGGHGGDLRRFLGGQTGPEGNRDPLTGEGFRDWTDRLRDVEEMVGDPQLRAEAARIRDRATAIRAEFKRHSEAPNWDLVREFIGRPLVELRQSVSEELLRRESRDALVPIDREPVPPEYVEQVRRYYERLGSGR